jgi:glycosyltransferase involved in cell wall biosynthesis
MQSILLVATAAPDIDSHGGSQRTRAIWSALNEVAPTDLFLVGLDEATLVERASILRNSYNLVGASARADRVDMVFGKVRSRLLRRFLIRFAWIFGFEKLSYQSDPIVSAAVSAHLESHSYDVVVALHLNTACRSGLIGRHPLIVDVDDYGPDDTLSELATLGSFACWKRFLLKKRLAMQQRIWPDLLKQVDALWVSNVENIKEPGLSTAKWVPNLPGICSNALERVESSTEKTVLMVGSLGRPQMQQGFEWFIYEVWPEILKDCSYARLRVVGGGAPERLKAAWQSVPGVILEGFVDDIVPVYQSADLVVCPIFQGAGTSIKLIEALGFSCPVVTTLFGLRGYQDVLKAGEHVEVAETPADFAEVSVILLNDDARACRLGQSGAEAVAATFTYECLRQNIQRSVSETLESSQS